MNVRGDLFQFVITLLFSYNIYERRKRLSIYNDHEVVVKVQDPKLVSVIEYLTTTEGVGPNP